MSFKNKEYIYNSYLTDIKSKVLSCQKINDSQFEILLDKTIFYPDMVGGQPKDEGTIDGHKVYDVIERNGDIYHIIDSFIEVGKFVSCNIDFDVRFDYMQQHTGQHILSCSFYHLYNAKTIGFHLSKDYTTIDIELTKITLDMINLVEEFANNIIYSNLEVETKIMKREDAIKTGLRKEPVNDEIIRVVKIGDKDNVACCGTPVSRSGEIGIIKIVKFEKYKKGTRITFLCGKRALKDFQYKNNAIHMISNSFSCNTTNLVSSIEKFKLLNGELQKKAHCMQLKINSFIVNNLINNCVEKNNINYIVDIVDNSDIKNIRHIANEITLKESFICILICYSNNKTNIVVSKSKNLDINATDLFNMIKDNYKLQGGGNNLLLQGAVNGDVSNDMLKNICKKLDLN